MRLKIFNGFQLKLIMTVLMLVDHIAQYIPNTPIWFHYLGRIVAPIFFFILVEGFIHTSNREKYMKRLFLWGFIMLAGSRLLEVVIPYREGISNNIFLSLASCFAFLYFMERIKENTNEKRKIILIICICLAGFLALITEASILGLGMVFIFYYLKDRKVAFSISYIVLSTFFIIGDFSYDNLFLINYQWMMVFSLPFILMYNGEKGRSFKYFFYVFYPLHIWVLYIIGYFLSK